MRDNSTDNTSGVTRSKGDTELRSFGIGILRLSEHFRVEELNDLVERRETSDVIVRRFTPRFTRRTFSKK